MAAAPADKAPASGTQICETRQLRVSLEGLLEALLALDRERNGWVWRGQEHRVLIDGADAVVVEARRDRAHGPQRMSYDRAFVAAALIHYCFLMRIPLPRGARKEIEITAEGVALLLTQTLDGPSLHLAKLG